MSLDDVKSKMTNNAERLKRYAKRTLTWASFGAVLMGEVEGRLIEKVDDFRLGTKNVRVKEFTENGQRGFVVDGDTAYFKPKAQQKLSLK